MSSVRNLLIVSAGVLGCAATTQAAAEFRYNIAVVNDFVFRGISQSDNHPAAQGGAEYRHSGGLYAGLWGSTQDIPNNSAHLRADAYGGFAYQDRSGFSFDIGARAYTNAFVYPGQDRDGFWELYGGFGWAGFSTMVYRDFDDKETYAEANWKYDIGSGVNLKLHLGHYFLKGPRPTGGDYTDYSIGFSKMFNELEVEIAFADTNQKPETDLNDTLFILSLKYHF
jgi:uncharacterized protein (TIGR02001 family)